SPTRRYSLRVDSEYLAASITSPLVPQAADVGADVTRSPGRAISGLIQRSIERALFEVPPAVRRHRPNFLVEVPARKLRPASRGVEASAARRGRLRAGATASERPPTQTITASPSKP